MQYLQVSSVMTAAGKDNQCEHCRYVSACFIKTLAVVFISEARFPLPSSPRQQMKYAE